MATIHEREQARQYIHAFRGEMPSSLRAPLAAVHDGTELPGTAHDVLDLARDVLARVAAEREVTQ